MIAPVAVAGILIMTILSATANAQEDNSTGIPQQPVAGCGPGTDNSTCNTTPNQQQQAPAAPTTAGCGPGTDNSTCSTTPNPSPSTPTTQESNNTGNSQGVDADSILAEHNSERAAVGVPPLVWSDKLAADAKVWAETLAAGKNCCGPHDIEHLGTLGEGENIVTHGPVPPVTAAVVIKMVQDWTAEKANFQPTNRECAFGKVCGHYTQMVWNTTKEVGCAIAKSTVGGESRGTQTGQLWSYLVCRYSPPGNYPRPPY